MKRRLRFGPPNVRLPQTSGILIRPRSFPAGFHTVAPLYPTARPALLETHRLPSTSQRTPSGPHFTPSIMKSAKRLGFDAAPSALMSNANRSPFPPGPLSPGPLPVLTTYSVL